MPSTLLVEYYAVSEAHRQNDAYPKFCDECVYPPVWTVRTQLTSGGSRVGYGCSDHIDAVMMKISYSLPPGNENTPPAE